MTLKFADKKNKNGESSEINIKNNNENKNH